MRWRSLRKCPVKDRKNKLSRDIAALETQLENLKYAAGQAMTELHYSLKDFDDEDYFEMNDVLNANHIANPAELLPGAGLSAEEMAEKGISKQRLLKESGGLNLNDLINQAKQKKSNSKGGEK